MTVADLISILQLHDPAAVVVLSTYPDQNIRDVEVVEVQQADVCAVELAAVDADEYRKGYAVVVGSGVPGVWLG
jgi:hypothetical protein